ncbi:MAG: MBOAT family O-acyltransferase [Bacteroidota bacterium]
MLFNSIEFAFFFPVVTLLFFLLPHRFRWLLLLLASCFFYMFFKPVYILILFFTIAIDYFAGIWIANESGRRRRKLLLLLSIVANVGVLAFFKYFNFLAVNINSLFGFIHVEEEVPLLKILLPIGLSFHTFQAMSYTIEVYRGNQQAERHFGIYALYVMFYPQLVAGPIERPQNILYQFYEKKKFHYENMRRGLILIAWGLVKKVVIADRLALFVNQVYNQPEGYKGIPLAIGTVFFAFQIFCDFSGYSDIAIGCAKCMGFHLMTNFNRPYQASSIAEFWKRWHISLSTWFRDYVYISLGGNRVSNRRRYFNLFVVFLLSGVWHGANWTFVLWGILHGIYLVLEDKLYRRFTGLKEKQHGLARFGKRVVVFFLVCLAWVFFRAKNVTDSFYIFRNIFYGWTMQIKNLISNKSYERLHLLYLEQQGLQFYLGVLFILLMILVHRLQGKQTFDNWVISRKKEERWSIYYSMVLLFILFGVFNRSEFIYFQF